MADKKHHINIEDTIKFAKHSIESELILGNIDNVETLKVALEELEIAVYNPESNRKSIVQRFLTTEPYCWCFIPNFAEIEQECIDTESDEIEVYFPYEQETIVAQMVF